MQEEPSQSFISSSEFMVLDPEKSVSKGHKRRIKEHFDKKGLQQNKGLGLIIPKKHIIYTSRKNLICCGFLAIICCGFGPKH